MADPADAVWLDEASWVSLDQLAKLSGMDESDLRELVDYGALSPRDPSSGTWTFSARCVVVARTAQRLHHDFELDAHGVSVMLGLYDRIEALQQELRRLRALSGLGR